MRKPCCERNDLNPEHAHPVGLSTRALKMDSLDTDPIRIQCGRAWAPHGTVDYAYCTAWLDLTHCKAAQHAVRIRIEAVWRQRGLWIWIPDPHRMRIQGPVWRAPMTNINISASALAIWIILRVTRLTRIYWPYSYTRKKQNHLIIFMKNNE